MNRRARTEWAKVVIGLVAGALALAYCQFLFVARHDFFLIEKDVAVARQYWNEVYVRAEVCPHDEMNGDGP